MSNEHGPVRALVERAIQAEGSFRRTKPWEIDVMARDLVALATIRAEANALDAQIDAAQTWQKPTPEQRAWQAGAAMEPITPDALREESEGMTTERYVTEGLVTREQHDTYLASLRAHIRYVQEAGAMLGVPEWPLMLHDDSKFGYEEFPAYARKFGKGGSPVDAEHVEIEFADAWLHHIHHNPHHWQHWIFPDGYAPKGSGIEAGVVRMPHRYALEMIADWMGASMAYTGSWDMSDWLQKNMPRIRLHSQTAALVREVLDHQGYADIVHVTRWAGES